MADDDQSTGGSDTASFGYGQQDPNDASDDFNKTSFLVRQMIGRMDTMKLVQVKAVHPAEGDGEVKAAGTVDVQPLVNQIDGGANATPHGTVYGIPWSRNQGGKNAVVCDPEVGDIGYVVVSDRDISALKAAKKRSNPGSFRQFNIADGVYAGGALNVAPEQYLVFTSTGVRLVDKNGNSIATTADGMTLTDSKGNVVSMAAGGIAITPKSGEPVTINGSLIVRDNLQLGGAFEALAGGGAPYAHDLKVTGDVIGGFGTGGQVGLKTHTHTQGNDGHGDAEQPTAAPTGGT